MSNMIQGVDTKTLLIEVMDQLPILEITLNPAIADDDGLFRLWVANITVGQLFTESHCQLGMGDTLPESLQLRLG
ncbi:hypothetical protein AYI72_14250 [Shewanella algae]|nr:hypothetical protein AYI72_14250 [Shewanella algae]TVL10668.1 hypothetical protein AYJ02_19980 [Shewanella algae]TVL43765.1 hypothetical protein AYI98_18420 [Shewanella algae]TVL62391.1 hypothetical protein AYJ00_11485 [Shewanella algae]TWO82340.1 hypothetical protein AYI75_21385 [Shewanella algae]